MVTKTFWDANIVDVRVDTNCPQGGDGGHGGYASVRIWDHSGEGPYVRREDDGALTLQVYGDAECRTLIDALRFSAEELERQYNWNEAIRLRRRCPNCGR